MITVEYLEFDINADGRGIMYLTCNESGVWYRYLACRVYNNRGLKFDLNCCELLGICNSEGIESDDFTPARHWVEECLRSAGVKTIMKNVYWNQLQKLRKTHEPI